MEFKEVLVEGDDSEDTRECVEGVEGGFQTTSDESGVLQDGSNLSSSTASLTAIPEQSYSFNRDRNSAELKTIIVTGLSERTTIDTIRNFIEVSMEEEVLDVAKFGQNSALITLENISDLSESKRRVEEKGLDGSKLTLVSCPLSSLILVSGLTSDTTHDALKYTFSTYKIGGKVLDVVLDEKEKKAIVIFEDSKVIQKVIESTWKLNNAVLNVDTYYEFLMRNIIDEQNPMNLPSTEDKTCSIKPCTGYERIQEFLNENSVSSETYFCLDKGVRRYILEHRRDKLKKLEAEFRQYSVAIKAGMTHDELLISGNEEGLGRVRIALHEMLGKLTKTEITIQQPGLRSFFASGKGERLVKTIEQELQCSVEMETELDVDEATVHDEDVSDNEQNVAGDDEKCVSFSPPPPLHISTAGPTKISCYNVDITWKKGNIVMENADVLVSSVIGQLRDVFNLAAGHELLPSDSISFGDIAVTPGHKLPCKNVIHTKCPIWDGENGYAEKALRSTVQKCLQKAVELKATSIAFPIIGTGGLQFDNYSACRIMITEVISATCGWGQTSLTDIRFVVFEKNKKLATALEYEFLDASGQSYKILGSGSVAIQRSNSVILLGWPFGYAYNLYRYCTQPAPYNLPFYFALGTTTNMFCDVVVHVLHGNPDKFVYEKCDAIVNLTYSAIGTYRMQHKLWRIICRVAESNWRQFKALSKKPPGSVVVTDEGSLNAGHIIHIIATPDVQHVRSCIEKCLKVADEKGFQFISMPFYEIEYFDALDGELAQAVFQTLETTSQSLRNLRRIRLVVFDEKIVPIFQQMQQYYGSGAVARRNEPSYNSPWPSHTTASKITFELYGENLSGLKSAESSIQKGVSEAYETRQIRSEYISKLNERQRKTLNTKAQELDVSIECGKEPHVLVIQGDREDVDTVDAKFKEEIQKIIKKENEEEEAKILHQRIRWQYHLSDDDEENAKYFDRESNSVVEKAKANNETRATVVVEDEIFDIDLHDFTGIGQVTERKISVKRTTLEGFPTPANWSPMPFENGKEKTVHLVPLSPENSEYQMVLQTFVSPSHHRFPVFFELPNLLSPQCRSIRIERIQNPHLYQQYMAHKTKMDKDNGRNFNERRLFHGTSEKNIAAINTQGFNRSLCGAHGTLLGQGVYFAEDSMYSAAFTYPNKNNERRIYLARVLTGHYRQGYSSMKVPPPKYRDRREVLYDSVANTDGPNPDIFAVFHDSQCYPEYLITFQYY